MSIASRITSIEEHIKESYQELEGIGIDTTEVDKNLENIPKLIDGYWETLPKVTEEGTSITLDSTKEGKMKIGLKGNTSQATLPSGYTAVDYIASSGTQYIDTGYIFTSAKEKIDFKYAPLVIENARVCGSYISQHRGMIIQPRQTDMAEVGNTGITPTFSISANTDYEVVLEADNGNYSFTFGNDSMTGTYVSTPITNRSHHIFAVNYTGTTTKASMKLYYYKMYDNDVLVRDYVPCYRNSDNEVGLYDLVNGTFYTNAGTGTFTYGSTSVSLPSPDFPIPINVVSGDNSIDVCGKNFATFNLSNVSDGIFNADGTINTYYGNTSGYDSTYYQLILDDSLKCTFTAFNISNDKILVSRCFICYYDKYLTTISRSTPLYDRTINANSNYSITLTPPTNAKYFRISFQHIRDYSDESNYTTINVKQKFNDLLKLQFEKGTSSTTYEAYTGASYPINLGDIELCKIGDYQDSIKKSTGKNLWGGFPNEYSATVNGITFKIYKDGTTTANGTPDSGQSPSAITIANALTNGIVKTIHAGTYTVSGGGSNYNIQVYDTSNSTKLAEVSAGSSYTNFTINAEKTILVRVNIPYDTQVNNITVRPMLNEGSTALPYEPYGKAWYVNKQIGKVVLDGSETSWFYYSAGQYFYKTWNYPRGSAKVFIQYISNRYKNYQQQIFPSDNNKMVLVQQPDRNSEINISNHDYTTTSDFKTWLSTHNTIVYYPLATPTYTEITDSTLISQLETLNGARSYTTQTNINQENNDNASILNASALSE